MLSNCFWWKTGVFFAEDDLANIDVKELHPFAKLLLGLYFHSVTTGKLRWKKEASNLALSSILFSWKCSYTERVKRLLNSNDLQQFRSYRGPH